MQEIDKLKADRQAAVFLLSTLVDSVMSHDRERTFAAIKVAQEFLAKENQNAKHTDPTPS